MRSATRREPAPPPPLEDDAEDVFEPPADDADDTEEDLDDDAEAEATAEPPKRTVRAARKPNPAHRQQPVKSDSSTSWWLGKDREEFSNTVAARADDLRKSPEAAKVKTPVNFVG